MEQLQTYQGIEMKTHKITLEGFISSIEGEQMHIL